jgi:hypothetical protein
VGVLRGIETIREFVWALERSLPAGHGLEIGRPLACWYRWNKEQACHYLYIYPSLFSQRYHLTINHVCALYRFHPVPPVPLANPMPYSVTGLLSPSRGRERRRLE